MKDIVIVDCIRTPMGRSKMVFSAILVPKTSQLR